MPKGKLMNLVNLGAFSNYKKLPTYKKTKPQEKENVSSNPNIKIKKTDSITGTSIEHSSSYCTAQQKVNLSINKLSIQQVILPNCRLTSFPWPISRSP
jgi:hypothetical protein